MAQPPADPGRLLSRRIIEIATACVQGVCGTCLTRLLAGEIEHHDRFLTVEERARDDQFTPCCSRTRGGTLVLDL